MRNLAARQAMMAKTASGWTNPYVTDGLVSMFDGEWNAGGGIHDSSLSLAGWVDIMNPTRVMYTFGSTLPSSIVWGDKYLYAPYDGTAVWGLRTSDCADILTPYLNKTATIEVAWHQFAKRSTSECFTAYVHGDNRWFAINGWNGYDFGHVLNFGKSYLQVDSKPSWVDYLAKKQYSFTIRGDNTVRLFVNGQSWKTFTSSGTGYTADFYNVMYSNNDYYYCIRYYNRGLTDAEIAANYAVDKERFGLT